MFLFDSIVWILVDVVSSMLLTLFNHLRWLMSMHTDIRHKKVRGSLGIK
jgi:hypothetical protein